MRIKQSRGRKVFNCCNIIFMVLLCVVMIYPYLNQVAYSLNDGRDSIRGGIYLWPRKFTWVNYRAVLQNARFLRAALISVSRVILTTVLSLIVTFAAAYGITRRGLPCRKAITLYLMIPGYISAGVIPVYMLYRYLHLMNSFWVYVLPFAFGFYNMVIMRSFLQELPASVEESARIDGANDIQIMFRVVMPMSKPVLATVALWVMVGQWNDWTTTLMYVTERDLYTLQYLMMQLVKESQIAQEMAQAATMYGVVDPSYAQPTSESIKSANLILTTLPIIMVYPFLQKYFIKGVNLGAVKE